MKRIILNGKKGDGKFAIIDDKYLKLVSKYSWHLKSNGYASAYFGGGRKNTKRIYLHHLITGKIKGKYTDHINNNKLDNRINNLRIATYSENSINSKKRKNGTSAYKGVSWNNKRKEWASQLTLKYKNYFLGWFKKEIHAAMAYDLWARELHGEFAKLNFPNAIYSKRDC